MAKKKTRSLGSIASLIRPAIIGGVVVFALALMKPHDTGGGEMEQLEKIRNGENPHVTPEKQAAYNNYEKERFKELSEQEGGKGFSKADKIELENLREKYRVDEKGNFVKIEYKEPIPNLSGKEGAKNAPSWAKGNRPYKGERGSQFTKRLLDKNMV